MWDGNEGYATLCPVRVRAFVDVYYLRAVEDDILHFLKIGCDTTQFRRHHRFLRQKAGLERCPRVFAI